MEVPSLISNVVIHRNFRSRHIRLTMHPDGQIRLTAPTCVAEGIIAEFLRSKQGWIAKRLRSFARYGAKTPIGEGAAGLKKHQQGALDLVRHRLEVFNAHYGAKIANVTIRNQKSRWGSCSTKRTLSFNYRIVLLPEYLADYLIVHELCHLLEFNHSNEFWALVEQTIPDHRNLRRAMRTYRIT